MLKVQRRMLAAPEEVAAAFPEFESEAYSAFYPLWSWLSEDIASRVAPPQEESQDFRLWRTRVATLLQVAKSRSSFWMVLWDLAGYAKSYLFVLALVGIAIVATASLVLFAVRPLLLLAVESTDGTDLISVLVAAVTIIGLVIYGYRRGTPLIDQYLWYPFCRWIATRCYRRNWRREAFNFMRRTVLDFFTFRALVEEAAAEYPDERTWMSRFIQQDYGLAVYSIAQRFQE